MLLFVAAAHAICAAGPMWTRAETESLGPHAPIYAARSYEHDGLAGDLRLRGPDGTLVEWTAHQLGTITRFRPTQPLGPGAYRVEEYAMFDGEGQRVDSSWERETSAWFVLSSLTVSAEPEPLGPLGKVDWTMGRGVSARVETPPGARWMGLEVEDLGVIFWRPAHGETTTVSNHQMAPCLDADQRSAIAGGSRVRVVAEGASGEQRTSRWTTVEQDMDGGTTFVWEPRNTGYALGELGPVPADCPSLALSATRTIEGDEHTRHLLDADFGLHAVQEHQAGARIDGRELAFPGTLVHLQPHGDVLIIGTTQGLYEVTDRVRTLIEPGFRTRVARDARSLTWEDDAGRRFRQGVDDDLKPGPVVEILSPIQVRYGPLRVNGVDVEVPEGMVSLRHPSSDPDAAVVVHRIPGKRVGHVVAVVDAHGQVLRQHQVDSVREAHLHDGELLVDVGGWARVEEDGSLTPAARPVTPAQAAREPAVPRIPWTSGHLVLENGGVAFEKDGVRSGRQDLPLLGFVNGELVHRRWDGDHWTEETVVCGTAGAGAPDRIP